MKYIDINKRYSEIVAEYMAQGYIINTASMSGSQGEIAKIDLTDGNEIIRIRVESFHNWSENVEGIEIVIGKSTDDVKPNTNETFATIWDSKLEVIRTERFYKISRYNRDYYSSEEEAKAASEVRSERYSRRRVESKQFEASPEAMEIAKRIVRRKMGYSRINSSNLQLCKGSNGYYVMYNGKTCSIR